MQRLISGMRHIKPMVISIWCARGPRLVTVTELNDILANEIGINGYNLNVSIRYFLCDSPARAFLKGMTLNVTVKR